MYEYEEHESYELLNSYKLVFVCKNQGVCVGLTGATAVPFSHEDLVKANQKNATQLGGGGVYISAGFGRFTWYKTEVLPTISYSRGRWFRQY